MLELIKKEPDGTLLTSRTNPHRGSLKLQMSFNQPQQRRWGHRLLDRTWNRNIVKPRDVFPHELSAQRSREIAQIPGDNLTGIGPGRVAVREIIGPHAVVGSPPRQDMAADGVVEESRVDLVVEVFTGEFLDGQALALGAMAFEVVVPLLQDKRNPAKLVLDEDDLELGETLEHTGIDQFVEAVDRLEQFHVNAVGLLGETGWGISEAEGTASAVAVPAQDVQVDRQAEILRGGPELVIMR